MISLEDYIKKHFVLGFVRFNAESHVTPSGVIKFRLMSKDVLEEFECIVVNNTLKVIENDYVKN